MSIPEVSTAAAHADSPIVNWNFSICITLLTLFSTTGFLLLFHRRGETIRDPDPDSGVNLNFPICIFWLILLLTGCIFLFRRRGETIEDAQTQPTAVVSPIEFDCQERRAFILKGLVEHEVHFADLSTRQCSINYNNVHQQDLDAFSCVEGKRFNDLEAPHIEAEQPIPDSLFQEIILEQGSRSASLNLHKPQVQFPLERLLNEVDVESMQTASSLKNGVLSTVEVSASKRIVDLVLLASGECTICMDEYKMGDMVCWSRKLFCNHAFHTECLLPWLMRHSNCPNCRSIYIPAEHV